MCMCVDLTIESEILDGCRIEVIGMNDDVEVYARGMAKGPMPSQTSSTMMHLFVSPV